MRRFTFALAKLHRLRAQQERLARRGLGAALAELGALDHGLAQVQAAMEACHAERDTSAYALARAVEVGLQRQELTLTQRRRVAENNVDLARRAYFSSRRDLRAITRLHEARREEWRMDCQREEQMEIEEMARAGAGAALPLLAQDARARSAQRAEGTPRR